MKMPRLKSLWAFKSVKLNNQFFLSAVDAEKDSSEFEFFTYFVGKMLVKILWPYLKFLWIFVVMVTN